MIRSIYVKILSLRFKTYEFFNLKTKKILYASTISSEKELSYLVNTIAATIPYSDGLELRIIVDPKLLGFKLNEMIIAKFQGNFIKNTDLRHIKIVIKRLTEFLKADFIIASNKDDLKKSIFFYKTKLVRTFDGSTEVPEYYKRVNWQINDRKKNTENIRKSKQAFRRLINSKKGSNRSVVIGGGPSVNQYNEINFNEYDFNISVNDYVISNMDFFENFQLDAVCFLDSTLFFGASAYTKEFFEKLQNAFNIRKFYIFVDIKSFDIVNLNGNFEDYIVGVRIKPLSGFKLFSNEDFTLSSRPSSSVLSLTLMIAMTLADEIFLLGADGLKMNQDSVMNNNISNSRRAEAYKNINAIVPDFYRSYEGAIRAHKVYDATMEKVIKFGKLNNKKINTFYQSNYSALTHNTLSKDNEYFKNVQP